MHKNVDTAPKNYFCVSSFSISLARDEIVLGSSSSSLILSLLFIDFSRILKSTSSSLSSRESNHKLNLAGLKYKDSARTPVKRPLRLSRTIDVVWSYFFFKEIWHEMTNKMVISSKIMPILLVHFWSISQAVVNVRYPSSVVNEF